LNTETFEHSNAKRETRNAKRKIINILTTKERYKKIIEWFQVNMPVAETELHHSNPYELLVAVILSAQCTDKRVNMIYTRFVRSFSDA
jgi:endonuclease-3